MIYIKRYPEPEYFHSKRILEVKEKIKTAYEDPERQQRVHFDESVLKPVMDDLIHQFQNKCAYCETSLVFDEVPTFVDNFRPKYGARNFDDYAPDHYWWLAYEWENLMLSCQMCDQKYKRDWFPIEDEKLRAPVGTLGNDLMVENALLIDPCQELPEKHLKFNIDGSVQGLTKKGKVTIDILGLNRTELIVKRQNAANKILTELDSLFKGKLNSDQIQFITELYSNSPSQEYIATQRVAIEEWVRNHPSFNDTINGYIKSHSYSLNFLSTDYDLITNPSTTFYGTLNTADEQKVDKKLSNIKRFSIKKVEIKNFKCINNLTLNILPNNKQSLRESWLLLLGDNGIGKSSILQAIAVALSGRRQVEKLELKSSDILRRGAQKGFVKIHSYEHNESVELYFDKNGFQGLLDEPPTYILAYGSTRLLPQGNLVPFIHDDKFVNIRNLFDYSYSLSDVNKWLVKVGNVEFNKRIAPALIDLLNLDDHVKIISKHGKLYIKQQDEEFALEHISDGYKSIIALASDIMQSLSRDNAGYHTSQGIVLIDELGNHLHPRWRMKIVEALRKAFPKLQFIVTTHEPLCLRGLAHGEVNVLVRDKGHGIRVLDKNLLPDHNLLRIDQLLTSDLFGLINTLDVETERKFEDYYTLLSKPEKERTKEEQLKVQEYTHYLADKEVLGSTPQLQALYQIINEKFAQKILAEGFKTKDDLKQETIRQVKSMIDDSKIDWL